MAYYKRNLPHFHPDGFTFFVTTRLQGTLPIEVYARLKKEYKEALKTINVNNSKVIINEKYSEFQKIDFIKYERILDACKYGYKWLENEQVAELVGNAIKFRDNKYYKLIAYTIMPNHLHILFTPIVKRFAESLHHKNNSTILSTVTKIMQDFKKYTARESNILLNRTGPFWQHESYDHVVRNKKELIKIVNYIMNNPVKAGLCKKTEDWNWCYYNPKYLI